MLMFSAMYPQNPQPLAVYLLSAEGGWGLFLVSQELLPKLRSLLNSLA
jgi:hypothetical protein